MAFSIEQFKSSGLVFGGARPSLFEINLTNWPGASTTAPGTLTFLAKASSLPPSIIDPIEIPYFGRRIKISGDRSFPPWSITVMNDENFDLRRSFEEWHQRVNSREPNLMNFTTASPINYKVNIGIKQFSKTGDLIYTYTMVGAFPTVVDPIQLDWEAVNQVEQFNVEFQYDYWEPVEINSGGQAPPL